MYDRNRRLLSHTQKIFLSHATSREKKEFHKFIANDNITAKFVIIPEAINRVIKTMCESAVWVPQNVMPSLPTFFYSNTELLLNSCGIEIQEKKKILMYKDRCE